MGPFTPQTQTQSPIGQHYHVCYECSTLFIAETTAEPFDDDGAILIWCGCDGSSYGHGRGEEKVCSRCDETLRQDALCWDDDSDHGPMDSDDPPDRDEHGWY